MADFFSIIFHFYLGVYFLGIGYLNKSKGPTSNSEEREHREAGETNCLGLSYLFVTPVWFPPAKKRQISYKSKRVWWRQLPKIWHPFQRTNHQWRCSYSVQRSTQLPHQSLTDLLQSLRYFWNHSFWFEKRILFMHFTGTFFISWIDNGVS